MDNPRLIQGVHLDHGFYDISHLHRHQQPHLSVPISYTRPHRTDSPAALSRRAPYPRLLDCSPTFDSHPGFPSQQFGAQYDPSLELSGFRLISNSSLAYYEKSEAHDIDWSLFLPPPSTSRAEVYGGRPSPGLIEPDHMSYDISPVDSPYNLTPRTLPSSLPTQPTYSHPAYRLDERRPSLGHNHYESVSYTLPCPPPPPPDHQQHRRSLSGGSSPTSDHQLSPSLEASTAKPPAKECSHCRTTTTPLWRREPSSMRLLCNACGLYLQQHRRLRPQELIDADSPLDDDEEEGVPGGPECSHCKTRVTTVWRRNKERQLVCNACGVYQRMRGKERPLPVKRKRIKPRPKVIHGSN
ncbi:hypothetical protein BDV98DRAFT_338061 [Pterulicium gracile]|uniref:GATA-type domain-containing protein n=1 Tax=Pterulicium gracile TaxID=1884261 RepID=A0A5C3Q7J0_9AGAR|nr:hypothetical protein BDV98DRAFT_338061 [Pterula gracilis]